MVAATYVQESSGVGIGLIHFCYGSRAGFGWLRCELPPGALDVPCTVFPLPVYKPSESPLLQAGSKVMEGRRIRSRMGACAGPSAAQCEHCLHAERTGSVLSSSVTTWNWCVSLVAGPGSLPSSTVLLPFTQCGWTHAGHWCLWVTLVEHRIMALGFHVITARWIWTATVRMDSIAGSCGPCYMRYHRVGINGLGGHFLQ
ncbi:glutamine amidotransferases class-II [Pseudomonas phage PIP]|nr:glutamine amidotransferases class-II [Pseudomonas phage PIP]